jgi:uncharacterized damage-inducible protein DinB
MTFIEFFRQQFIEEGTTTRKMLSRIQEHQLAYQPHPKSMDMKRLATHIADLPGWIHLVFNTDELDFAQPYPQPEIHSTEDLMTYFEQRYKDGLSTLVPENEALLYKPWTLRNGDTVYSVDPKIDVIRMALSQQIHHRAQLGVYLRLLDTPIPGSYGPSADEAAFEPVAAEA